MHAVCRDTAGSPFRQGLFHKQVRRGHACHAYQSWIAQVHGLGFQLAQGSCPAVLCVLCAFLSALQGLLRKLGAGFEDILPSMLGMGSSKMKVRLLGRSEKRGRRNEEKQLRKVMGSCSRLDHS